MASFNSDISPQVTGMAGGWRGLSPRPHSLSCSKAFLPARQSDFITCCLGALREQEETLPSFSRPRPSRASLLLHPICQSQSQGQPRWKGKGKRLHLLKGGMTWMHREWREELLVVIFVDSLPYFTSWSLSIPVIFFFFLCWTHLHCNVSNYRHTSF